MAVYVSEQYGPTKPIRVEAEDVGDLTIIKITIDRKDLVAAALPALIQKLNAPPAVPKKKRKSPTKKGDAPKPDAPGQSYMPGTPKKDESWAAPVPAPTSPEPSKTPGGTAFPFGANEKLPGVAVVTQPGETLAKAKERTKKEQAAPAITA